MTSTEQKAREVADAVMYEGFLLYPYTASALKNQSRWQFGVVMPLGYADASEPSFMETQLLAQAHRPNACVDATIRFLQDCDAQPAEREVALHAYLHEGRTQIAFELASAMRGTAVLRIVRDSEYYRLTLRVQNIAHVSGEANRNEALRSAFISAHVLFTIHDGRFISLLDPPDAAKEAASRCRNHRSFPVLIGEPDEGNQTAAMVLASPIILYDFPAVAQQSAGHTFDSTEIDELLLLSVASMTDEEKREASATDPRARAIVDRADSLSSDMQLNLHGRSVRIHPKRRADAFDIFAEGKTARVKGVHEDVDGRRYVSVIFDDDPASDLHDWYGRSFFYELDEVEFCHPERVEGR